MRRSHLTCDAPPVGVVGIGNIAAAPYRKWALTLDLKWDVPLNHRPGSETRLAGVDVYYEFKWRDVFPSERAQFKNGQCLAELVRDLCPPGKRPALLLTLREGLEQGFRHT